LRIEECDLMAASAVLSVLLCLLAVVGVFIEIPFISVYAFWVLMLAYFILLYAFVGAGTARWSYTVRRQ
jgi:hypothetical protein